MKNILVTGAAGGMGRAVCRALAGEGYRVFGIDRAEPEDFPSGAVFIPADVTRAADLEAALERVRGEALRLGGKRGEEARGAQGSEQGERPR